MEIKNLFLDKVDSTQLFAQRNYKDFDPSCITCMTASYQTNGFGRYKRKWISPDGMCLASTFYFRLNKKFPYLYFLCQLLCLSLAKVLILEGLFPKIKWPNDIMLNNKKLAGVLCQTEFEEEMVHIFLGIGININMDQRAAQNIDQPATSLFIETKKIWDREKFLNTFQKQFLKDLDLFLKKGLTPFLDLYLELLLYKDNDITIFDGKNHFEGRIEGLTDKGELIVKGKNDEVKIFSSGDVNLKSS